MDGQTTHKHCLWHHLWWTEAYKYDVLQKQSQLLYSFMNLCEVYSNARLFSNKKTYKLLMTFPRGCHWKSCNIILRHGIKSNEDLEKLLRPYSSWQSGQKHQIWHEHSLQTTCTNQYRRSPHNFSKLLILKVKTSIGNAPIAKNEMEALITNHVKDYVLTNTWW